MKTIEELVEKKEAFKTETARSRFHLLHPKIQEIALDAYNYALTIGVLHPVFTDTVTTVDEDKKVAREHDQHRTRVAFDFRVIDWNGEQIDAMTEYLNERWAEFAYVTGSGVHQIAYYHDNGHGLHFHCAINAKYKQPEFKG